jgi:hypothetical protein
MHRRRLPVRILRRRDKRTVKFFATLLLGFVLGCLTLVTVVERSQVDRDAAYDRARLDNARTMKNLDCDKPVVSADGGAAVMNCWPKATVPTVSS